MLEAVYIDDEDFCFHTLEVLERSFAIRLPKDLSHITNAGDLFDAVTDVAPEQTDGLGCDSQMAFYRLRRVLPENARADLRPDTPLKSLGLGSPRSLKRRIEQDTGLNTPSLGITWLSCTLFAAVIVIGLGAGVAYDWSCFAVAAIVAFAVLTLDRGEWAGDWETAGSLSHALARHNFAMLMGKGASDNPAQRWRRFTELLAEEAWDKKRSGEPADARAISRQTRLVIT